MHRALSFVGRELYYSIDAYLQDYILCMIEVAVMYTICGSRNLLHCHILKSPAFVPISPFARETGEYGG
jgi:hypothetical protein